LEGRKLVDDGVLSMAFGRPAIPLCRIRIGDPVSARFNALPADQRLGDYLEGPQAGAVVEDRRGDHQLIDASPPEKHFRAAPDSGG